MVNTPEGQKKALETIYAKYGSDYYKRVGALGGKVGRTGGFASKKVGKDGLTGPERAMKVGIHGGRKSKRIKKEEV
jgi:uncharacterized protein